MHQGMREHQIAIGARQEMLQNLQTQRINANITKQAGFPFHFGSLSMASEQLDNTEKRRRKQCFFLICRYLSKIGWGGVAVPLHECTVGAHLFTPRK